MPIPWTPVLTTPTAVADPTSTFALEADSTQQVTQPAVQSGDGLWIHPALMTAIGERITVPGGMLLVDDPAQARMQLGFRGNVPVSQWVYALVAPFPTIPDGVTTGQLEKSWNGEGAGPFRGLPLMMSPETYAVLAARWGDAAENAVHLIEADQLLQSAWESGSAWAVVPFEALEPRWKVLEIDGQSPIQKKFDPIAYPLTVHLLLQGDEDLLEGSHPGGSNPLLPATNRSPDRLTVLAMTGVTALVRATAYAMEQHGVTYPAEDIGAWLSSADITHISNEVPFDPDCPFPDPVQRDVVFCSDDRYVELLEVVGTDVVELTGDHFADFGTDAMYHTLDMYEQRGWKIYGGGANLPRGRAPLTLTHNGNQIAFIGCNAKGGGFATATDSSPGAVYCDFPYMETQIRELRTQGYLPVATFQHFEYYTYNAQPNQVADSQRLTDAGAVIVSGSQAHQPQAFEFHGGGLIHYGLGNMFFDQYEISFETRQGFIDRHVFYNGRHISTELLTILFIDFAKPRPMTAAERSDLLRAVFNASGW